MTFAGHRRPWVLATLFAINVAACAALNVGDASGSGGAAGAGAAGNAGTGGNMDFDAAGGGGTGGDYTKLCGPGTCDVSLKAAISSCQAGMGTGGAAGSSNSGGAGAGGAAGSGGAMGGAGGATTGGAGSGAAGSAGAGGAMGGAGGATTGGAAGSGGNAGDGGAGGGAGSGAAGNSGTGGGMGGAGGATTGGAAGSGGVSTGGTGGAPPVDVECKLVLGGGQIERSCVASGNAAEFAPCNAASDCGPGLGCVLAGAQGTGVCRTYCCGSSDACGPHTYCAPRPMAEAADPNVKIPVCVDADDCTLLDTSQCGAGLVCAVVSADGTTACIAPGPGKQGDPCPCAGGFACSKLKNQCYKICHIDPASQECDSGYSCQHNASLPDGFGLCVSPNDL